MKKNQNQTDYLNARAAWLTENTAVTILENELDARLDDGKLSEAEFEVAFDALDRGALNTLWDARKTAEEALLVWGLAQTRRLWPTYGKDVQGTLADIEALYAAARRSISVKSKVIDITLALKVN